MAPPLRHVPLPSPPGAGPASRAPAPPPGSRPSPRPSAWPRSRRRRPAVVVVLLLLVLLLLLLLRLVLLLLHPPPPPPSPAVRPRPVLRRHARPAPGRRSAQLRGGDHLRPHPLPRLPGRLDINAYNGAEPTEKLPYPIIADAKRELAVKLGMLDPDEVDKDGLPLTARVVFVFGPDKKLKLSILYPATTGRNFDEILRVIDSLQLTACKKVATPVDWKSGDSVMVIPSLPEEEAKKLFPKGVFTKELPSAKRYLRYTPQP
uniref:Peroxiredoxin 6 n=1 Tax=Ornithorhynchus anatinus TaxID=9258 RepID=A0A6I8PPT5_ORNAN